MKSDPTSPATGLMWLELVDVAVTEKLKSQWTSPLLFCWAVFSVRASVIKPSTPKGMTRIMVKPAATEALVTTSRSWLPAETNPGTKAAILMSPGRMVV